jgi:tetratricopeptide (TPR) repeat protein
MKLVGGWPILGVPFVATFAGWAEDVLALDGVSAHPMYPVILAFSAYSRLQCNDPESASQSMELAEELGAQAEDPIMSRVCVYGTNVFASLGRYQDFMRLALKWLEIAERGGDEFTKLQAMAAVTSGRTMRWGEGDPLAFAEDLVHRSRSLGNPSNTAICLTVVGNAMAHEGRLEEAEELLAEALDCARPAENHYAQCLTLMIMAMLRFGTGQVAEAMSLAFASAEGSLWKDYQFFFAGLGVVAGCLVEFGSYREAALLSGLISPVLEAWSAGLMWAQDPDWREPIDSLRKLEAHMDPIEYAVLTAKGRTLDNGQLLQLARQAVQAVAADEASRTGQELGPARPPDQPASSRPARKSS